MDDARITVTGAGNHAATKAKARTELLEAATAALRWFDLFDQHAPSDIIFGGEAEDWTWADAADPDEAQALDEERTRLGRAPTERERAAFLGGFRAARLEHANVL